MMLLPTVGYSTLSESRELGTAVMTRWEEVVEEEEGEEEAKGRATPRLLLTLRTQSEAQLLLLAFLGKVHQASMRLLKSLALLKKGPKLGMTGNSGCYSHLPFKFLQLSCLSHTPWRSPPIPPPGLPHYGPASLLLQSSSPGLSNRL